MLHSDIDIAFENKKPITQENLTNIEIDLSTWEYDKNLLYRDVKENYPDAKAYHYFTVQSEYPKPALLHVCRIYGNKEI